jgi:hypothetical protein
MRAEVRTLIELLAREAARRLVHAAAVQDEGSQIGSAGEDMPVRPSGNKEQAKESRASPSGASG